MIDLSSFRETCAYCYNSVQEGIVVFECGSSYCNSHLDLHSNKCGCSEMYSVYVNEEREIKVKTELKLEVGDLEERLKIKIQNGMVLSNSGIECRHIYQSKNIKKEFNKQEIKCSKCSLTENLWICLDCGNIGCGRIQPGAVGNGHALEHFEQENHRHSILATSIDEGNGDTFCYLCDDFVQNPYKIEIKIKNQDVKKFSEINGKTIRSNQLGFKNEGQNCYASAIIHLLCEAFRGEDLSEHFSLCFNVPTFCIACQFIKVLNEVQKTKDDIKYVRIKDLLSAFFMKQPTFSFTKQQDCSEFMCLFLDELKLFENEFTIPNVTKNLEFKIVEKLNCEKCEKQMEITDQGQILYAPFKDIVEKSIKSVFKQSDNKLIEKDSGMQKCSCGFNLKSTVVVETIPPYLAVYLNRNSKDNSTKINDPIELNDFEIKGLGIAFESIGAVIHKGDSVLSGHYTWLCKEDGKYLEINDDKVVESNRDLSKYGSMFLFKIKNF